MIAKNLVLHWLSNTASLWSCARYLVREFLLSMRRVITIDWLRRREAVAMILHDRLIQEEIGAAFVTIILIIILTTTLALAPCAELSYKESLDLHQERAGFDVR